MKKLVIAFAVFLLASCAMNDANQLLDIKITPTVSDSKITSKGKFALASRDLRKAQYVAIIKDGASETSIPMHAKQNMRTLLEKAVYDQFKSQGFLMTTQTKNKLILNVEKALVSSSTEKDNSINADVILTITAQSNKGKFEKSYRAQGSQTEFLAVSNEQIQSLLSRITSLACQKIAEDKALRKYMAENF